MACVCGHSEEEHGGDPKYPGSTACNYEHEKDEEPCDCIAFEDDGDGEDDEE